MTATANQLIAAFPQDICRRWAARLERVEVRRGDVLHDPERAVAHVYFPATCILSLLYNLQNGASAEIAVVGHEGMVGIQAFMGGKSTLTETVVRSTGEAFRLPVNALMQDFEAGGAVTRALLRYTQALMTQMAQTAACNRHHTLDQQMCRLLLLSLDRLHSLELWMTHELIANMLGVRREGVTEVALELQRAGVMRYARGHITVLDRAGLEARSCECYRVVKTEYDRLLPGRSLLTA